MAKDKKSFLLYCDVLCVVKELTDEQAGKLFKHLLSYVNDEDPKLDDVLLKIAFTPIKQQLKRDLVKYEKICESRSESGSMGSLKQWHPELYNAVLKKEITLEQAMASVSKWKQMEANEGKPKQTEAKIADIDTDTDTDIDTDTDTDIDTDTDTDIDTDTDTKRNTIKNVLKKEHTEETSEVIQGHKKETKKRDENIDKMIQALKLKIGIEAFVDSSIERNISKHCISLMNKISTAEFSRRLGVLLADDFHRKNCNKIKYVYNNIKGFIEPKSKSGGVFIS